MGADVSLGPHQVASGVSEATLDRWLSLLEADGWRDDAYGAGAIVLPGRARLAGLPRLPGVDGMFRGWVVAYRPKPGARFTSSSVRLEQDVTGARALLPLTTASSEVVGADPLPPSSVAYPLRLSAWS